MPTACRDGEAEEVSKSLGVTLRKAGPTWVSSMKLPFLPS